MGDKSQWKGSPDCLQMVGHLELLVHTAWPAHQTRASTVTVGTPTSFLPFELLTSTATSSTPHPMKTERRRCCVSSQSKNLSIAEPPPESVTGIKSAQRKKEKTIENRRLVAACQDICRAFIKMAFVHFGV